MSSNQQQVLSSSQVIELEEKVVKDFLKKNKYIYEKILGQGDFSLVIKAFSQKLNCHVAIKVLKKIQSQTQVNLEEFDKEINILQMLKNEKYVLQIIEKIQDDKLGMAAIVTELCDCNLTTILEMNKLEITQVHALAYQLLKSLLILQEKGIIHSDIKPDNILYSESKNQFLIADYGLSKILTDPSIQKTMSSLRGNIKYMSPEVVGKQKPYSILVDIYSIGMLLTEAFLQNPFTGMQWLSLKSQNLFVVFPNLLNSIHFEFIDKILSKMVDPNNSMRLEPINLLQHLKAFNIDENSLKQLKFPKDKINEIKNNEESELNKLTIHQYNLENLHQQNNFDYKALELQFYKFAADSQIYQKLQKVLQNFKSLTYLVIKIINSDVNNQLIEKIADGISNLQKLTHLSLYLSKNQISSKGVGYIENCLYQCQSIRILKFSFNGNQQLGNQGAKHLANIIQKQENIIELTINLADCQIGESGIKNIANSIKKHENLTKLYLNLHNNSLTDYGITKLSESIQNLKKITQFKLNIEGNSNIYNSSISSIAEALKNSISIKKLTLKFFNIHINSNHGQKIAESLEKFQNMTELTLKLSQEDENQMAHQNIANALQKLEYISKLDLFISDLNLEGLKLISQAIKSYKYISQLRLCLFDNQIGLEGAKIIAETIQTYYELTNLTLQFDRDSIGIEGFNSIAQSLEKCKNIKKIILYGCYLSKSDQQDLEQRIKNFHKNIQIQIQDDD